MPNRLLKLLADNRGTAARCFQVQAAADPADDSAEILLYDAIVDSELEAEYWGGVSAAGFVKALREVTASTIHLRINSPGGSVFAARAIETALREHKARIVVHIDGLAASAATFIAMVGEEIIMSKGAMFMIHKAWTFAWGNADDLAAQAALLNKIDGTLVQTYADRTGQKAEDIAALMAAETWFTAQEAVDAGFVDSIAADAAEDTTQARAAWNLSAYQNVPHESQASVQRPADRKPPLAEPQSAEPQHRQRQQQRLRTLQLAQIE